MGGLSPPSPLSLSHSFSFPLSFLTDNLMEYVKLKENAHLVDLTRSKVTVETLTETKITCTTEEKVKL